MKQYRLLWSTLPTSKKINKVEGGKWWRIGCHLVYTWLIPWQDDDRRLRGDPLWLLVNIFPNEGLTEKEIGKILVSLQKVELIYWYKVDDEGLFIEIREDEDHQRIRKDRYKPSIYPPPCLTDDGQLAAECQPNGCHKDNLSPSSSPSSSPTQEKNLFFESVYLTDEEHKKLIKEYGDDLAPLAIEELNNHKMSTGKKYKSDYHAILKWAIDAAREKMKKKEGKKESQGSPEDIRARSEWNDLPEDQKITWVEKAEKARDTDTKMTNEQLALILFKRSLRG